ncbi:hypothetical protein GCM10007147_05810 [Nocardiopsis kunsanensis]|uniref:Uncharacterized protein n=1 Tax=Nocardiopsis kunsanensis TaxID=141693 RepID=A0A918X7S4_9ACTN|nr:hypothetical protein GCM10007147_05810 [Nocardiopsis kunsanensis]
MQGEQFLLALLRAQSGGDLPVQGPEKLLVQATVAVLWKISADPVHQREEARTCVGPHGSTQVGAGQKVPQSRGSDTTLEQVGDPRERVSLLQQFGQEHVGRRVLASIEGPVKTDLDGGGLALVRSSDDESGPVVDVIHNCGQVPQGPPVAAHERHRFPCGSEGC